MATRDLARENQFRWTLTVEGRNCGVWAETDDHAKDSEETKTRPGAGEEEESLGGSTSYDNLNMTARWDRLLHPELEAFLDKWAGKGKAVAKRTVLDRDNMPTDDVTTFSGTLKKMVRPGSNSDGSDAANLAVELTIVSVVS